MPRTLHHAMPAQKPAESKQDYVTPWELVRAVSSLVDAPFYLDLAATAANARASYFLGPEQNSLVQPWAQILGGRWGWLNPPWNDIEVWAEKCFQERFLGAQIAFHVPATVGSNWYRDFVHKQSLVLALNGRVAYEGMKTGYPKDCIVALYSPRIAPGFDVWTWRSNVRQRRKKLVA